MFTTRKLACCNNMKNQRGLARKLSNIWLRRYHSRGLEFGGGIGGRLQLSPECNKKNPTRNVLPALYSTDSSQKKGLLERLAEGPVVGDGSFIMTMEKRGYVLAGDWTPEASVQYPEAVRQLHREFLRAGADVMQTFTFYAQEDRMDSKHSHKNKEFGGWSEVNRASCQIAREVADEGGALVAGSLCESEAYEQGKGKDAVQDIYRKQSEVFVKQDADFLLAEFIANTEEAEWAIEAMKEFGLPVACTMRLSEAGDASGATPGEAAVRMTQAGADVIGMNCCFDPAIALEVMSRMKDGLTDAGLDPYLMVQPVGFHTQELAQCRGGYTLLPEFPFALEPRALTRIDVHKFARRAYEMGIRYIGGCCGFEPHHIRAIAEELEVERGRPIPGKDKYLGPEGLTRSHYKNMEGRDKMEYWTNLKPSAGRKWISDLADLDTREIK